MCTSAQCWTCTWMCEAIAATLDLLFAFSTWVDQPPIGGDPRVLWRKLSEFSCRGQFVFQIHNLQPNLLINNKSGAVQVFVFFFFFFGWKRIYESTWCIPHDSLIVFCFLVSGLMHLCVCIAHPSDSCSSGTGEVSASVLLSTKTVKS